MIMMQNIDARVLMLNSSKTQCKGKSHCGANPGAKVTDNSSARLSEKFSVQIQRLIKKL